MKRAVAVAICVALVAWLVACSVPESDARKPANQYVPQYDEVQVQLHNGQYLPCLIFRTGYPSVTCDWGHPHY